MQKNNCHELSRVSKFRLLQFKILLSTIRWVCYDNFGSIYTRRYQTINAVQRKIKALKRIKELFNPQKQIVYYAEKETRQLRLADYTKWLLIRIFILATLLVLILIPIVSYLMATFEGRDITTGQAVIFIVQSLTTTGYGEHRSWP
jgi:hypothetical protein